MNCPLCKGETDVIDSRPTKNMIRRRRKCQSCGHRFSTVETMGTPNNERFGRKMARQALKKAIHDLEKRLETV